MALDPAQFTTEIDNPYWPMAPGTQRTYRETDGQGGEQKVVVTVTNETKQIANGITARVVQLDRQFNVVGGESDAVE